MKKIAKLQGFISSARRFWPICNRKVKFLRNMYHDPFPAGRKVLASQHVRLPAIDRISNDGQDNEMDIGGYYFSVWVMLLLTVTVTVNDSDQV